MWKQCGVSIMHLSIILLSCVCLLKADDMEDMIKQLHDTCVAESKVTEELLEGTRSGNFPEVENLKCYFKCLMSTSGVMDETGAVDVDVAIAMVPPQMASDSVISTMTKCASIGAGKDPCDTAFNMYKCLYVENPAEYFVV